MLYSSCMGFFGKVFNQIRESSSSEGKAESSFEIKRPQLLMIIDRILQDEQVSHLLASQLSQRDPEKFSNHDAAKDFIRSIETRQQALGFAKYIDQTFGTHTFRILGLLNDTSQRKTAYKLLEQKIKETDFESQVENGYYLNLLENYGVSWNTEKVSRDVLQNFFDANGQTLDGVDIQTRIYEVEDENGKAVKRGTVIISAPQDYDWRELIHFGGTTKKHDTSAAGGFGEGLKIGAFVLLRDSGAISVKAAARDWELSYYFDELPKDAYRESVRGLHAKKKAREFKHGNYLEIVFEGDDIEEKMLQFQQRELFYTSDNSDFQGIVYNRPGVGGFKIIPPEVRKSGYAVNGKGNLYIAGQRTHFDRRDRWNEVTDVSIWTWQKLPIRDRDRGLITRKELDDEVITLIVDAMSKEEMIQAVQDFKPLWDSFGLLSQGDTILERIVKRLHQDKVTLEFETEYLANDMALGPDWIIQGLKSQGFKLCRGYMQKIGMKTAKEQFKDWQSHSRIEADKTQEARIKILQQAARAIGLDESKYSEEHNEIKDVWLFSASGERSIVHGQYNPVYYWISQEQMNGAFYDALGTYVHEAAHRHGAHGNAKFDYALQDYLGKMHKFITEKPEEWQKFQELWNQAAIVDS
jgi:hypothetical protein